MEDVILIGARSPLLPDYEEVCSRLGLLVAAIVSVDDQHTRSLNREIVIALHDLTPVHLASRFIASAFSPIRRAELVALASGVGLRPATALIDPAAVVASSTRVGLGVFISVGVTIGAAGLIGDHVVVNRSSSIGHHALIGDFVSIGPGVTITGNVRLGNYSYIGAGSTIS